MTDQENISITLVVSIDGVAPRHLSSNVMPCLVATAKSGAACFDARTITPSITLPAHASMLLGVDAQTHGIFDNTPLEVQTQAPSFLKQARLNDKLTATFTNWLPFECLFEEGAIEEKFLIDGGYSAEDDDRITQAACQLLENRRHHVVFVYLCQCDLAGHRDGWDSLGYIQALSGADNCLKQLTNHLKPRDSILITTDHGGLGTDHQQSRPEDLQIFVVAKSPKIEPGTLWPAASILQVPPTVASLAEFEPSKSWSAKSLL